MKPAIVIIAGPTASGKTATALRWAKALDGELVGADSVQVYRRFDIGSAKPTSSELDGVPHHLIDVIEPTETIDAMHFAGLADTVIESIHRRGKLPIIVGGTGLWIRALVRGLVDLPPVDEALRATLTKRFETQALQMHQELSSFDPLTASKVHQNDVIRVVRAFEVYAQTGEPLGELRRVHALGAPRYPHLFVALASPPADLDRRIEQRIDDMLSKGWREEVRDLVRDFGPNLRPLRSVGYRQIVESLQSDTDDDTLKSRIRKATRLYAKRQRTWFKGEPGVHFRPTRSYAEADTTIDALARLTSRQRTR